MKFPVVLLLGSLAANAALLVLLGGRGAADGAAAPLASAATSDRATSPRKTDSAIPVGREFLTLSPEQLRERLRALDLPANVVAWIVQARISERLEARTRELVAEAMKTAPAWRFAKLTTSRLEFLSAAQRKELRELEVEARDLTLRLLGPAYADPQGRIAAKYAFLPPEKAVLLDALDSDYENMRAAQRDDARYLQLPSDKEREKFLRTEQDRDLAGLLTPAEREAYELRASPVALNTEFRSRIAALNATEAEYRALFALQKTLEERAAAGLADPSPRPAIAGANMISLARTAREPSDEQVRAAIGDARLADWQLARQPYYQGLAQLGQAQNIPPATTRQLGTAINAAMENSWRVSDDSALTPAQKRAALADLAGNLRTQLVTALGEGPANGFLRSQRWFEQLNTGTAVIVNGTTTSFRNVDVIGRRPGAATPLPRP